jgi:hypothetical protein
MMLEAHDKSGVLRLDQPPALRRGPGRPCYSFAATERTVTRHVELKTAVAEIIRLNDEMSSLRHAFRQEIEALRSHCSDLARDKKQLQCERESDALALSNAFARFSDRQNQCLDCEELESEPAAALLPASLVKLDTKGATGAAHEYERPIFYECLKCQTVWLYEAGKGWVTQADSR